MIPKGWECSFVVVSPTCKALGLSPPHSNSDDDDDYEKYILMCEDKLQEDRQL